jgi:hypothetical protein
MTPHQAAGIAYGIVRSEIDGIDDGTNLKIIKISN